MERLHKSPRPVPVIFTEPSFSKKRRLLAGRCSPPPAPAKSAPPISRVFRRTRQEEFEANRPRSVSFISENDDLTISSPRYDSSRRELYFDQCFHLLSKLGSGSFGEAYKVQSKEDGLLYAIKKSRQHFKGDFDRKQKLEEVNKLEQLQGHANCVRFYKAWEERQQLYIQTELCEMSLQEYANNVVSMEEKEIWHILVDLLKGLSHLHKNEFVHMDIKPDNLFLGRDGLYKIGDFGLVLELSREISDALEGDPKYMAPELMEGVFTKSADIFSLGVTILELASGVELPTGGYAWQQLRHATWPSGITEGLSDELVRLIRKMMDPDPIRRPTVEELLDMPVVQQAVRTRSRRCVMANMPISAVKIKGTNEARTKFNEDVVRHYPQTDVDSTLPRSSLSSSSTGQDSLLDHSSDEDIDVGWLNGAAHSPVFSESYDYEFNSSPIFKCRPVSESSPHPYRSPDLPGLDDTPSPPRSRQLSSTTPLAESGLRTRLFIDCDDPVGPLNLTNSSNE